MRSFALASAFVCHCIFSGESDPPRYIQRLVAKGFLTVSANRVENFTCAPASIISSTSLPAAYDVLTGLRHALSSSFHLPHRVPVLRKLRILAEAV
jgi:hypothetical protein